MVFYSDFDMTLTRKRFNGEKGDSSFTVFHGSDKVTDEFTKESQEAFSYYHPIEKDPNIPVDEKMVKMVEWWKKDLNAMVKQNLTHWDFDEIILKSNLYLRTGITELFEFSLKHQIPWNIVSAGIGQVVNSALDIYIK